MEKIDIVIKIIRNLFLTVLLQGLALMLLGICIYIWPDLLSYLVSFFFIVLGVVLLVLSFKIRKLSKFTIQL